MQGKTTMTSIPPELELQIEQGYDEYLSSKSSSVANKPLRDAEQTFADAMCEGSIVENLSNGQEVLEFIKRAGCR
jgi:hypothetical protein